MANKTKSKHTKTSHLHHIIWFFIRKYYESKQNVYVPVALKHLILKFAQKIIGCNMLTLKEDLQFYQLLYQQCSSSSNSITRSPISHPSKLFNFRMLYRASDNNFTSESFHKYCDNHADTITIIKSNYGNIFGGYTSIKWSSPSVNDVNLSVTTFDDKSFLFTIRDICNDARSKDNMDVHVHSDSIPKLHLPDSNLCGSVTLCKDLGPTFGHDIQIVAQCNDNHRYYFQNYTSQFTYNHNGRICGAPLKSEHDQDLIQTHTQQNGTGNIINNNHRGRKAYFFSVVEYEVFQIV